MASKRDTFTCASCGYMTGKWMGFCPQCRASDSLQRTGTTRRRELAAVALDEARALASEHRRIATGVDELDRVLGDGLVPGSVTLLGGDPGIGKSTLMLQAAARCSRSRRVAYVSGEESVGQVAARAGRVVDGARDLVLAAERDADGVAAALADGGFAVVVIDSIQTMSCPDVDATTGGAGQLREAAARIIAAAKTTSTAVVLVGHVTKDGSIAGPRQLEHMVDVVLQLEGDPVAGLRYLRSIKNRFGSVDLVGIFTMDEQGLHGVADPTALFSTDGSASPGSVLFPAIHGRRALLVEVQALVAPTSGAGAPRRSVRGIEHARVHQLIAVLERHVGIRFADRDVFVSVAGGLRTSDPAVDLPVALALAGSHAARSLPGCVAFGEVGLTGGVRPAQRIEARYQEAARLGDATIVEATTAGTIGEAIAAVGLLPDAGVVPLRSGAVRGG
jgi:DNA repair protein RadA/Sms